MPKRQIWEDLLPEIDKLYQHNQADINAEGFLPPDANPIFKGDFDIRDFNSIPLHQIVREIVWDKIDVEFDDDSNWEQISVCGNAEQLGKKDTKSLTSCKEEYDQLGSRIQEEWSTCVLDKCAWYQSYHYLPRNYWGIHILESCLIDYAKRIYKYNGSKTKKDAIKSAFLLLLCHELFHYITDNATSILEIAIGKPLYIDYSRLVYQKDYVSPGAIEEALANRFLFGRYKYCKINWHFLFRLLKGQPKGYRDFDRYKGEKFKKGLRELINQVYTCSSPTSLLLPIEQLFALIDPRDYSAGHRVPIWLHTPIGSVSRLKFV